MVASRGSKPNVVLIGVDTLRPDHLGCYGYERPTSPSIDVLAEQSIVFDTAIAAGIPTTPSFTTLLTGLHPYRHRIVTHPAHRRLPQGILLLPELAKRAGLATVACDNLVVQGSGNASWFARGFDDYSGFVYSPFGQQSRQLTDRALRFVHELGDEPFFLFIHYWDPHTPYGPLPPFDSMHYEPNRSGIELAQVRAIRPEYYEKFLADMHLRRADDYDYVVAQYDGEISQLDEQIGRLLTGLRSSPRWNDTIICLVSDHGECFGEGNFYFDHHGLYDAVTRIALMLRLPGQAAARTSALVSHEDILPTLCELAGFGLPDYPLTGHSLTPLLNNGEGVIRSRVISCESTRQASLALRTRRYKLIVPVVEDAEGRPIPDFYGLPRSPDPLLFDLDSDLAEKNNLAPSTRDLTARLSAELEEWCGARNRELGEPDPIRTQGLGLPYEHFLGRLKERAAQPQSLPVPLTPCYLAAVCHTIVWQFS